MTIVYLTSINNSSLELTFYLFFSPVSGGNDYRNLALHIGGISNFTQYKVAVSRSDQVN
jgi:hypothetical protein